MSRKANTPYSLVDTSTTPSTTTPTTPATTSAPAAMNKILYIDGSAGKTMLGNHTLINGLIRKLSPGEEKYIYTFTMYIYIYVMRKLSPPQWKSYVRPCL